MEFGHPNFRFLFYRFETTSVRMSIVGEVTWRARWLSILAFPSALRYARYYGQAVAVRLCFWLLLLLDSAPHE